MTTTITLNQGQQAAADGFFNFLFSKDSELIISGPGGVGKTFLMGHLIDQVMPHYHESCHLLGIDPIYQGVMMTATTNKAAEVLGQATRRPTSTVHSFLNLLLRDDFETGISKLVKSKNWTVHRGQILFIDECSMIDGGLLQMIREGTHQCKIVYVGDHCQLAPIQETISPIYKASPPMPFYELLEPVRNANQPALLAVCTQLRETVETGKFRPIKTVPGVIDLLDGPSMEKEIQAHFKDPTNHDRILAYTNNQVIAYNDYIRIFRGLPSTFTVGEHVVSNTAIQMGRLGMIHVEDEFRIDRVTQPCKVLLDEGVEFEVIYCTLSGSHYTFEQVPVPVDRDHFNKLVKYYQKQKSWRMFYQLKNNYPDLRPRDAATVHKAQGSTYETVFVDLDDLSTCHNPNMAARLLYVAFTRAKQRVVLYGKLAPKYGGVVS